MLSLQQGEPRTFQGTHVRAAAAAKARERPCAVDRGVSYVTTAAALQLSSLVQPHACGQ